MSNRYLIALAPADDRYNTSPVTARIRCPGTGRLTFLIVEGAGGTGTATITANAYAANSGGAATLLTFRYQTTQTPGEMDNSNIGTYATTAGIAPAAGASKITAISFRADELPAGKPYVALTLTELVNSPAGAAVVAIIEDGDRQGAGGTWL